MTIQEYLSSLRGKTAAVLGIGVSNTPLIESLCPRGVQVISCDKKSRQALRERAPQLEALGAQLHLGEAYLDDLRADVVALFGKDVAAGAECLSAGPDERQELANLLERKTAEFQVLDD